MDVGVRGARDSRRTSVWEWAPFAERGVVPPVADCAVPGAAVLDVAVASREAVGAESLLLHYLQATLVVGVLVTVHGDVILGLAAEGAEHLASGWRTVAGGRWVVSWGRGVRACVGGGRVVLRGGVGVRSVGRRGWASSRVC